MKSFATLAVSALAVNAQFSFDSSAYITGFSQQFGLDQTAVADANDCVTGIQSTIVDLIQTVQQNQNDLPSLLLQAQGIAENIQATLASDCQPIAEDFATAIYQKIGNQDIREVVRGNFQQYFPQLVQQVSFYLRALFTGDDAKAGQTEAYIFQILLGVEQPETLPLPEFTQYVPFDQSKFVPEYYGAFFNTLGMNNVDIESIGTCITDMQSFVGALATLINKIPTLDFVGKIEAVKDFVVEVAPNVEGCDVVFEMQKTIFEKAMEVAGDDKLGFLGQTIENLTWNFPEYVNLKQKAEIEILEGEYVLAGEDEAKALQIIDGSRIFN